MSEELRFLDLVESYVLYLMYAIRQRDFPYKRYTQKLDEDDAENRKGAVEGILIFESHSLTTSPSIRLSTSESVLVPSRW